MFSKSFEQNCRVWRLLFKSGFLIFLQDKIHNLNFRENVWRRDKPVSFQLLSDSELDFFFLSQLLFRFVIVSWIFLSVMFGGTALFHASVNSAGEAWCAHRGFEPLLCTLLTAHRYAEEPTASCAALLSQAGVLWSIVWEITFVEAGEGGGPIVMMCASTKDGKWDLALLTAAMWVSETSPAALWILLLLKQTHAGTHLSASTKAWNFSGILME